MEVNSNNVVPNIKNVSHTNGKIHTNSITKNMTSSNGNNVNEMNGKVITETNGYYNKTNGISNNIKNGNPGGNIIKEYPEIEFKERESLLTQMFQVKEFRGLYNIFLVILINLTIYTTVSDYVETGKIDLGLQNIKASFGQPLKTGSIVIGMHLTTLLFIYPTFKIWAKFRKDSKILCDLIFSSWILIVMSYFIYIPLKISWENILPVASGAIVALEQVRMFMKMYAFLRSNIARELQKPIELNNQMDSTLEMPTYSTYVYFLYAPTLLYRDSYPRTKIIRWGFIIRNIIELFGCIFVYNLLHQICGYVLFENIGLINHKFSNKNILRAIFFQMIPGGIGWLLGFFILLHTSQNISAELLRFSDRQFYKDWWNSSSYSCFYRNWNLPVHHFLYNYIYLDAKKFGFHSNIIPTIGVFLVSAIFHEYVLIFVLRFFYPVLLVFFGVFGLSLNFVQTSESIGNTFIWWSLITGKGLILFFYSMEYFARLNNCPAAENPFVDFFIPRSWSCDIFSWE